MFSKMLGAQMLSAMKFGCPTSLSVVRVLRGFSWMSKDTGRIFEYATDDGFVRQASSNLYSTPSTFVNVSESGNSSNAILQCNTGN